MSPKSSSLAYHEIEEDISMFSSVGLEEAPQLNLIVSKRMFRKEENSSDRAISISGQLSVSF